MTTKYLVIMHHPNNPEPTLELNATSLKQASTFFMELVKKCRDNFETLELVQMDIKQPFVRVSQLFFIGKNLNDETPKSSIKGGWHT